MPFPVAVDDWILIQGEAVVRLYTFTNPNGSPFNLTGYSLVCQVRQRVDSLFVSLNPQVASEFPTTGQLTLSITAAQTDLLSGVYVFDIKAISGATVVRLVEGTIRVDLQVTR